MKSMGMEIKKTIEMDTKQKEFKVIIVVELDQEHTTMFLKSLNILVVVAIIIPQVL